MDMKKIVQYIKSNKRSLWGIVILAGVLLLVYGIFFGWVKLQPTNQTKMPSVCDIVGRFFTQLADLKVLKALGITLLRLLLSLIFAVIFGLLLGFAFGNKKPWAYTQPTVDFLRSIPVTFFIPILAIVLLSSNTINIYLLTIYPTSLLIMFGVRTGIQKQDLERFHFFDVIASKQQRPDHYRKERIKLILFEALPDICSGFRVALSYGLVVITVLEYMHIGQSVIGLGELLESEVTNHDKTNIFAIVLLIGTIGFLLNKGAEWLQHKYIHWSNENLKNE